MGRAVSVGAIPIVVVVVEAMVVTVAVATPSSFDVVLLVVSETASGCNGDADGVAVLLGENPSCIPDVEGNGDATGKGIGDGLGLPPGG